MKHLYSLLLLLLFSSCSDQDIIGAPPSSFVLNQNFPNPFTDTTVIEYGVPATNSPGPRIKIVVFDRFHDELVVLRDSSRHPAGNFQFTWKPYSYYPPGLYYIELHKAEHALFFSSTSLVQRIVSVKK